MRTGENENFFETRDDSSSIFIMRTRTFEKLEKKSKKLLQGILLLVKSLLINFALECHNQGQMKAHRSKKT